MSAASLTTAPNPVVEKVRYSTRMLAFLLVFSLKGAITKNLYTNLAVVLDWDTMDIRVSVAVFLSIVLLSVSSFAAACDLSCSLQRFHAGCQTSDLNSSQMQNTDPMPADMDMGNAQTVSPKSDSAITVGARLNVAFSCVHEPCSQTSASTSAKNGTDRVRVKTLRLTTASVVVLDVPRMCVVRIRFKSPPPKVGPLDPISVSLRI